MEKNHQKPHAIMIAYPLQGHVIPSVQLAMKLASKGFTITFVNTQSIHHQITKSHPNTTTSDAEDIFTEARKSGLDIRYNVVSDGFPLGFDRSLNHDQFLEGVLHVMSAHIDELVANTIKTNPPPTCLIADTFFVWSSMISNKYNLVNVSFWTEPALVFTLYYHLDLLRSNGHFASIDNRDDVIDYIPGVRAVEPKDLMSYLQASDISTVVHRIIFKAFEDVKKADFIICNTVQELEHETISALNKKQPTYAIGPIFRTGFTKSVVATSLWSESDCTQWLDTKRNGSVLYISFGSYAHASKNDIAEIAHGLLLSGVSFIWVLRPDIVCSGETDFLPVGFEENIKGTGMIVPWCCQIAVISHPAVGGFLTHCGWNSILESVWCTVPLICFPLLTDQFTNRKLAVDDWKIGLNLSDKKQINRDEVVEKIHRLISRKSGDDLRKNIKEVKKKLENALSTVGSSEENFNQFICDVQIKTKKKRASANHA
ncbi:UDP-glucuronosyl/UDP-glucosyltransferase - like 10 [Theobroma cacao]|uniref:Glycosyltransferase n=1 Tax=Theobroma cacao TaxID=3641 RepID=A0A061ESR8_THECC|nr:UDP-Glycosyltransferase superfamily protein [Theobroma cacao]WRX23996.1 UDP-glucuronosyl/UDP-glucosyltransferase - like 10 [Theobroma cacao]